ncbi:DUF4142 domain-containing protein [Pedobacter metabolipauper]|nr:DUF4142 domain-containing protein [Pedobacter metabolipauper]
MKTLKIYFITIAISASLCACQNTSNPSSEMKDSSAVSTTGDNASADSAVGANTAGNGSTNTVTGVKEQNAGSDLKNETNESNIDDDGAAFIKEAGLGGMMEVELGKLAQSKASSSKVKEFAAKMVTDHTRANNELKAIAEKQAILVPTEYPADQKAHITAMKTLKGAEFDKHYMDMMVNDHVKTLALFKSAMTLRDDKVKDFAAKTLPILEGHHKLAVQIKSGMK